MRFSASYFILYANAFSLGSTRSRWILLSTIRITASSSVSSRTSTGIFSMPIFSHAILRRCPLINSKLPSPLGRASSGVSTPYSRMLSISSSSSPSSATRKGCPGTAPADRLKEGPPAGCSLFQKVDTQGFVLLFFPSSAIRSFAIKLGSSREEPTPKMYTENAVHFQKIQIFRAQNHLLNKK